MKAIFAVLVLCVAAVYCQGPSVPSGPPAHAGRPKGCSPGCGSESDMCAELSTNYCRPGASCSVCIKISSIRIPGMPPAGPPAGPPAQGAGYSELMALMAANQQRRAAPTPQRQSGSFFDSMFPMMAMSGMDMGFGMF